MPTKRVRIFVYYLAVCVILGCVQLALGMDISVLALAFLTLSVLGVVFLVSDTDRLLTIFALLILTQYSFFPFLIKTFLGQRLDLGLYDAQQTFTVALISSAIVVGALVLSQLVSGNKKLLKLDLHERTLLVASNIAFYLGVLLTYLHILTRPVILANGTEDSGFGGFGQFTGLLYFGLICATSYLVRTRKGALINVQILVMLICTLILSLLDNVKLYFTLALIAYGLTLYFSGRLKFNSRQGYAFVMLSCILLYLYLQVVVPIIQIARTDTFRTSGLAGRVQYVLDIASTGKSNLSDEMDALFNYRYFPGVHTPIVDRLDMLEETDMVVASGRLYNRLGWQPVTYALLNVPPSILSPQKPQLADVDLVSYQVGYISSLRIVRKTFGLFAVAYAMFPGPGWEAIAFTVLFLFFYFANMVTRPNLQLNELALFLLVKYGLNLTSASVEAIILFVLRDLPIDILTIALIVWLSRIVVAPKRASRPFVRV